jgi:hypothetical protein
VERRESGEEREWREWREEREEREEREAWGRLGGGLREREREC